MNVTIEYPNLYRILRDYEVPPYLPRPVVLANNQGYPHTQPTLEKLKLATTPEYQFFWRDLIIFFAPAAYKANANRIFQRVTDGGLAWCNKNGSDENADYVNGNHLINPITGLPKEAIKQEMLCAKGNVVRVIGAAISSGGENWLPIETLRMDALPTVEFAAARPWLVHAMTTITPELLTDGTYRCNPFHDFGGDKRMEYRVPLPIISRTGVAYLPESQLVKVGNIPSPYNP